MATLYPEVERLRVARDRLVRLRAKVEMSPPAPEDLPRSREWVARESLAHVDEMLPYWLGEIERILAATADPGAMICGPDSRDRGYSSEAAIWLQCSSM